jgi:hypothetical protein
LYSAGYSCGKQETAIKNIIITLLSITEDK